MCKVSIVLATYNGEDYIEEQLKSLVYQTMPADEVLISDDCSNDNTIAIINKFIKENALKNWKLYTHSKNQGWKKNFYNLLCKASGDVIFMCDQDDIWRKDKIEVMYHAVLNKPEILCLVGNYVEIDGEGTYLSDLTEERADSTYINKILYQSNFYWDVYLGCTMCITRTMLDIYRKFDMDFVPHDTVCSQIALLKNGLYYMPYVTIEHRLHGNNTTCIKSGNNAGTSNFEARVSGLITDVRYFHKLSTQPFITDNIRKDVAKFIECQETRYNFCTKKSLLDFVKELQFVPSVLPVSKWIGDFAYTFGIHRQMGKISRCIKR